MKSRIVLLLAAALLLSACSVSLAEDITPPPESIVSAPSAPQSAETPPPPVETLLPPNAAPDIQNGKTVYEEKCSACHGARGMGDGTQSQNLPNPVFPFAIPQMGRLYAPAFWYTAVTNGIPDKSMPSFADELSDEARWDAVAYAYSLALKSEDTATGKTIYETHCAACHGAEGTGGNNAADFTDQHFMASLAASDIFGILSEGTPNGMPTFSDKLDETERWAVAAYVRGFTLGGIEPAEDIAAEPSPTSTVVAETPAEDSTEEDTAEPTVTPTPEGLGEIIGTVTNASGSEIPKDLTVTLRGFDMDAGGGFTESVTLETTVDEDGTFRFENVPMPPQRAFMAVVSYDSVGYTSEPGFVAEGVTTLNLPVTIYDTSSDASLLSMDRWHVFLDFADSEEGSLQIIEVFVISNPTNTTIVAENKGDAVLTFSLPEGAENIQFQEGDFGDRYIQTENGFGDTMPIVPGVGQHQIVVGFTLPYTRKLDFSQTMDMPVDSAIIMSPEGVKVKSDILEDGGTKEFQGTIYHLYSSQSLPAGAQFTMKISGKPKAASPAGVDTRKNLLIGAGALGVALIFAGIWLYLRDRQAEEEWEEEDEEEEIESEEEDADEFEDAESIMDAIIALDDAYRAGNISEDSYKSRRAALKRRLKDFL
jgi:mono/diheme cytochrome c family protein